MPILSGGETGLFGARSVRRFAANAMRRCARIVMAYPLAIALLAVCVISVQADEGLWTFDNFPSARVKAEYGVTIDKPWLDHVMGAAVRLSNGCSASVVSAQGLVLTNNHCVEECAQNFSDARHDYYTNGYVASEIADEKRCAGLSAEVLKSISDVTPQVNKSGEGLDGAAFTKAHAAAIAALEQQACSGDPNARCQVIDQFHGGQYKLYKYRRYDDVRLDFSPGSLASYFGGYPDDFNFPRYDLDAAFVRLYDKSAPASTPDHLRWNSSAPHAGELVFVAGNPRRSQRQLTVSQLQTERDVTLPFELVQAAELRGRLIRFGEESAENKRISQDDLSDLENHYKYSFARLQALNDEAFFAKKVAEETELRAKAGADVQAQWATIAQAEQARRDQFLAYGYVYEGPSSELFDYARTLVRGAIERTKPNADRLPAYADNQLAARERELLDDKPVYPTLEQLKLEFWLSKAREYMTADDPSTALLLGRDTPEQLSAQLSQSRLGDPAERDKLWKGGLAAVQASDDPMVRYVLRIEPATRALRAKWEESVAGPETRASAAIARARLAAYGSGIYPDTTGSLRITYGKIDGWTNRGKTVPPFTYLEDLYDRATGQPPYKLDPRWLAARDKLNLNTVFNMSTTNDTINGNSGSPLINARGEVVGVFFDGNIYSLGGDYGYDPKLNRAVALSAAAINEALTKVYDAKALAKELAASGSGDATAE